MKITVEHLPQSTVRLDIAADPEEFDAALERAFRRISQQVQVPGFRPGRAPRALVERRVGRELIVAEAQRELMDRLYREALQQHRLTPVAEPEVEIYQDEPLAFRVEVQVYPQVDLDGYRDIRVEPREVEVTEEEIDQVIEGLRRSRAVWKTPDEPRQPRDGDQVIVDIEAYEGEQPFQEPLRQATFVLGESNLFAEIDQAIRSLRPGESAEFDISFAEEDERVSPELRGKTLHYRVTVHEVKEAELPEVNDEFAQSLGVATLSELRDRVRRDLLREKAQAARAQVLEQSVQRLLEVATVELPPALVERQVAADVERLREQLRQRGSSLEEYLRFQGKTLEEFKEELRPQAEARLRRYLVLEAFAEAEGIAVSEEELVAEIERLALASGSPEQFRAFYSVPSVRSYLADELHERKVSERLLELVTEGRGAVIGEAARVLAGAEPAEGTEPAAEEAVTAPEVVDGETTPASESAESLAVTETGSRADDDQAS
ncbi:MAG: trigger factor [Thermomicrobium sp.]|uniref:trigger factor n=1 Tax=Thermomicrobium sp. TaxID=1969469 RepID=UPI001B2E0471|nr:trigger factor [Thermomicrobium sp.]MBO9358212.1 trigger factor [Thermomicrobium sp.]